MTTSRSEERRLERMREVWLASAPEASEIARARRRFVRRHTRSSPLRLFVDVGWGLAAAALVIFLVQPHLERERSEGSAVVASGDRRPATDGPAVEAAGSPETLPGSPQVPGALTALKPSLEAPFIERQGAIIPLAPGVVYEIFPGESVAVVVSGERIELRGPKFVELLFEADRASGFRVHLSDVPPAVRAQEEESPGARGRSPAPRVPGGSATSHPKRSTESMGENTGDSPAQSGAWSRVADALRRGDRREAEQGLSELAADPAGAGSDSAALALAQLWIARGERARAEPVLQRLSRDARSELVRRRALELLTR